MKWMLDTNICIAIITGRSSLALNRLLSLAPGDAGVSAVTMGELCLGVAKSLRAEQNAAALAEFVLPLEIAPFDASASHAYATVRAALEKRGRPIGALDTMIAAHALAMNVTLVTNNVREFARVPGLDVVNWMGRR